MDGVPYREPASYSSSGFGTPSPGYKAASAVSKGNHWCSSRISYLQK